MDEKEYAQFQKELVRDPRKGPLSRGTRDLMAVMQMGGRPRPAAGKGR